MTEREFALDVVKRLRKAGFQAFWAGGCVRDELLGREPEDYDVATDARPEEVQHLFRRTVAVGTSFGVIEVIGPQSPDGPLMVQVATFRSDVSYSDGRHPDTVVFSSAREDAQRRDFTINGMFYDPVKGELIDYVGGKADLENRILRAIGEPAKRFAEDKLRMLRAVRFATVFDLTMDRATAEAIKAMAEQITVVSAERIAEELRQLLGHARRARGVNLLHDLGLAAAILPEILSLKSLPGPNKGDMWDHIMRVLELLGANVTFPLAFAALLSPLGCNAVQKVCPRLRLSNAERDRINWLVEKQQYLRDARKMPRSRLKMILAQPAIRELLVLHRALALAETGDTDHVDYCEEMLTRWTDADLNPPPLLTGHDLIRHGLKAGPHFKHLLDAVREAQLEGTVSSPEEALQLVDRLKSESLRGPPQ